MDQTNDRARRKTAGLNRREFVQSGGAAALVFLTACRNENTLLDTIAVNCVVYPAVPPRLSHLQQDGCYTRLQAQSILLGNGYLEIELPLGQGTIAGVLNKITGQRVTLTGDQIGFQLSRPQGEEPIIWYAGQGQQEFDMTCDETPDAVVLRLKQEVEGVGVTISYRLQRNRFWVERTLALDVQPTEASLEGLVYGKAELLNVRTRVLELGKYDRPGFISVDQGGLFAGVGWWFYEVTDEGVYQNPQAGFHFEGEFESEPWYLGVFGNEEGEPEPGWLWYKTFLQARKQDHDKLSSWSYWNAGWGQWGIDIDDPSAPPYLELMKKLGVRGVALGSGGAGKGIPAYLDLLRSSKIAQDNLEFTKTSGLTAGFLENGNLKERWESRQVLQQRLNLLKEYSDQGFGAFYFDFFNTIDTFHAHKNVTTYFRATREALEYTECHLGMAEYGPQFQREVLLNHPTDLHGFHISHFSSDWATFLGFRHSRRQWQKEYQYLMPEYSLYYFLTHYSNWGHPRRYVDPEPQQFLYGPHAYCGIAFNFHDRIGFRKVLAAASAFTPFFVFGHLELKMPEEDVRFAKAYLEWVSENADVLSPARVCMETEEACVVSKIHDGKGTIFLLNYGTGRKNFQLELRGLSQFEPNRLRQVFPHQGSSLEALENGTFRVEVDGESVVILDLNSSLRTAPPQDPGHLRIALEGWQDSGTGVRALFDLPDIRGRLSAGGDDSLPKRLTSLDQLGQSASGILNAEQLQDLENVKWLGRGELPDRFLEVHGFENREVVETWKFAPWAFADRIWLVYQPAQPVRLEARLPEGTVNGQRVELIPRVDYRPKNQEDWNCPLFFADITDVCRFGSVNSIELSGLTGDSEPAAYIVCAAARGDDSVRSRTS